MVWNNTQSSLYRAPRRAHSQFTPEIPPQNAPNNPQSPDNAPPRSPHDHAQSPNSAPPRSPHDHAQSPNSAPPRDPHEHAQSPDNTPPRNPHDHPQSPNNAPPRGIFQALSGLTNDKDALLLIGLIFLLLHEKADMKLVLALAFVLLC
ncbi:MAG: hypothetical protein ACI4XA_00830 [Oscillospiraceae bacterium]